MPRKTNWTDKERQAVYDKYNGHCAYCGKSIKLKSCKNSERMYIDHIVPVILEEYDGVPVNNDLENLNPACFFCNFYKSTYSLEDFRKNIEETCVKRLEKIFNFKLLVRFGIIKVVRKPVKFYFEKEEE